MKPWWKSGFQLLLITTIWVTVKCNYDDDLSGFILTAPWEFDSGSSETVCLTLTGVTSNGQVSVTLTGSNGLIAQTKRDIYQGASQCFQLKVPSISARDAVLSVKGSFDDGYSMEDQQNIKIRHTSDLILIQTDKQFYKPGQKVQIRVLQLTTEFLPSANAIRSIVIENPFNVRLSHWSSPPNKNGIIDLNFQISKEPQLGVWTISVEDHSANQINKTFRVQEYVLPEFSVQITVPSVIPPDFERFDWKVCAYYTYGEAVVGHIKANVTRVSKQASKVQKPPAPPTTTTEDEIRGCKTMTVNRKDLKLERSDFRHYDILNFHAEVTEQGTGTIASAFQQKDMRVAPLNLYLISKQYFKPGLPYNGKILIEKGDGIPVEGELVGLQTNIFSIHGSIKIGKELQLRTNNRGIAEFSIPSQSKSNQMFQFKIKALNYPAQTYNYFGFRSSDAQPILMKSTHEEMIKSWFSPSRSYIQIERPTQALKCNQMSHIVVHYTLSDLDEDITSRTIYFELMARNNVLTQESKTITWGKDVHSKTINYSFKIPITIEPAMSPKVDILVYYIRDDAEIVSDSETFSVEECYANKVEIKFKKEKILPGATASLQLTADSNSLCAVSMTDKSTRLLSGEEFSGHKVFNELNTRPPNRPGKMTGTQCTQYDPHLGLYERNTNLLGSKTAFDKIGMLTMTDLIIESNPCQVRQFGGSVGRKQFSSFYEDNWLKSDHINQDQLDMGEGEEKSIPAVQMRNFFPETWLWELVKIGNNGEVVIERNIPHTITNWTGQTFCMSAASGLGVSPLTSIASFQAVFLSYKMPYSVQLGETLPVIVTAFNYLSGCFPVAITLEQSKAFKMVSDSNEVNRCICGGSSYSHKYYIEPLTIGDVNVTVRTEAVPALKTSTCGREMIVPNVQAYDAISKNLLVKAQGVTKETTQSGWICASGDVKFYKYPLKMPSGGITGSARASVTVSGDLIAPTISSISKLVQLPTGCGEQNMIKFVPLQFLLHYLKTTEQLTDAINKSAISHMELGYQNELKYRRKDGSFSIWGMKDRVASTWLTAFVVKSFAQAKSIIYIDPEVTNGGIEYIVKNQLADGCFKETGRVSHKEMQGGIGAGDKTPQALTLFVTIALLEAGYDPTSETISRAFACIGQDTKPDLFRLAMKAYAASLANNINLATSALKTLEQQATKEGDLAHWTNGPKASLASNIETTSYALLAMVTLKTYHSDLAIKAVRWLVKQRNSRGGFMSTQDTVLALQALEKQASQSSQKSLDIAIKLKANKQEDIIRLNSANRLATQTRDITTAAHLLEVTISGRGCALIQVTLKYNTKGNHKSPAFYLDITVSPYLQPSSASQYKQAIKICTKYTASDKRSNMAIIEIQMVTGYEADDEHLDKLINPMLDMKKWEKARDGDVVLYFDELTNDLKCLSIVITEKLEIANRKPAVITVYDYYRPELKVSQEYKLPNKPDSQSFADILPV